MAKSFKFFPVRVAAVRDLTPGFRRFTFTDESLASFGDPGYDQRIKLVFPLPEHDYSALLDGDDWYTTWRQLPDGERHPVRTYTTRYVRRGDLEMDVDVVRHGVAGPASAWIETAAVGDELLILGPDAEYEGASGGIDFVPPERTAKYLLAGDETAAPAIAVILEQLPRDASGIVVLEVPGDEDRAYLPAHPGFDVRCVARADREHGDVLFEATRTAADDLAPPGVGQQVEEIDIDTTTLWEVPRHAKGGAALKSTALYTWLAGEAGAVKKLRRHLVGERGLDRRSVAFMGYWRLGRAEN